jgi:1-deoxy-D-xylulose-5-phosphate synthase
MPEWRTPFEEIEIGKGRLIRKGEEIAILSFGHPGNFVVEACAQLEKEGLRPAHYDMRFAKPLDEALLHQIARSFSRILTVEDGTIVGGFGSAVLEFMAANNYYPEVRMLGIPDRIVEHGKPEELHKECGFDAAGIARAIRTMSEVAEAPAQSVPNLDLGKN